MAILRGTYNRGRRVCRWSWLLCLAVLVQQTHAQKEPTHEYKVKAAFLYNFAKFVEWPAAAFADQSAPFTIGILGKNPFGNAFAEVADKPIKGRVLRIEQYDELPARDSAQVLFISASQKDQLPRILDRLNRASVLTISEVEGFAHKGGIINFILEGNKVRFQINPGAADRAGLHISAKLLKLSRIVSPE